MKLPTLTVALFALFAGCADPLQKCRFFDRNPEHVQVDAPEDEINKMLGEVGNIFDKNVNDVRRVYETGKLLPPDIAVVYPAFGDYVTAGLCSSSYDETLPVAITDDGTIAQCCREKEYFDYGYLVNCQLAFGWLDGGFITVDYINNINPRWGSIGTSELSFPGNRQFSAHASRPIEQEIEDRAVTYPTYHWVDSHQREECFIGSTPNSLWGLDLQSCTNICESWIEEQHKKAVSLFDELQAKYKWD